MTVHFRAGAKKRERDRISQSSSRAYPLYPKTSTKRHLVKFLPLLLFVIVVAVVVVLGGGTV
jgi:hypothetical protein